MPLAWALALVLPLGALGGLSDGSVSDALRAQRASLEALKIAAWANPSAERIVTVQQGAHDRLQASFPAVKEPEFVPASEHTYSQAEVLTLPAEDRELLYEFQLEQAKVHAGLALTMLQERESGEDAAADAMAQQQTKVMDVIAHAEASARKANQQQEQALTAKLSTPAAAPKQHGSGEAAAAEAALSAAADAPLEPKVPDAPLVADAPKAQASVGKKAESHRRRAAVDESPKSVEDWRPASANDRDRRELSDVLAHEKTLQDRVVNKNQRIDEILESKGEAEAKTKELEEELLTKEQEATALREQEQESIRNVEADKDIGVNAALDVADKAKEQVDKLVAGAIARDKANSLHKQDVEAAKAKAGAMAKSAEADELLRQMEENAKQAALKAKKLRQKAEQTEQLKTKKRMELAKLEALEAKAAKKVKKAEHEEKSAAAEAWKAMSEAATIRKQTADAHKAAKLKAGVDADIAAGQTKDDADCQKAAEKAASEAAASERAKVEAEIEAELSAASELSSAPMSGSLRLSARAEAARKRVADAEARKAAAEVAEQAAEADRVKSETAHLSAEEALKRSTETGEKRAKRERIVEIHRRLHAAKRAAHDRAARELVSAQLEVNSAQDELTKALASARQPSLTAQAEERLRAADAEAATTTVTAARLREALGHDDADGEKDDIPSTDSKANVTDPAYSAVGPFAAMAPSPTPGDGAETHEAASLATKAFFDAPRIKEPPPMHSQPNWDEQQQEVEQAEEARTEAQAEAQVARAQQMKQQQQQEKPLQRKDKSVQEQSDDRHAGIEQQQEEEAGHYRDSAIGPFKELSKGPGEQTEQQQALTASRAGATKVDLLGVRPHSKQDLQNAENYMRSLAGDEKAGEKAAAGDAGVDGGSPGQWSHIGDQRIRAQKIMTKVGWLLFERKQWGSDARIKDALTDAQAMMEAALKADSGTAKNETDVQRMFEHAANAGHDALRMYESQAGLLGEQQAAQPTTGHVSGHESFHHETRLNAEQVADQPTAAPAKGASAGTKSAKAELQRLLGVAGGKIAGLSSMMLAAFESSPSRVHDILVAHNLVPATDSSAATTAPAVPAPTSADSATVPAAAASSAAELSDSEIATLTAELRGLQAEETVLPPLSAAAATPAAAAPALSSPVVAEAKASDAARAVSLRSMGVAEPATEVERLQRELAKLQSEQPDGNEGAANLLAGTTAGDVVSSFQKAWRKGSDAEPVAAAAAEAKAADAALSVSLRSMAAPIHPRAMEGSDVRAPTPAQLETSLMVGNLPMSHPDAKTDAAITAARRALAEAEATRLNSEKLPTAVDDAFKTAQLAGEEALRLFEAPSKLAAAKHFAAARLAAAKEKERATKEAEELKQRASKQAEETKLDAMSFKEKALADKEAEAKEAQELKLVALKEAEEMKSTAQKEAELLKSLAETARREASEEKEAAWKAHDMKETIELEASKLKEAAKAEANKEKLAAIEASTRERVEAVRLAQKEKHAAAVAAEAALREAVRLAQKEKHAAAVAAEAALREATEASTAERVSAVRASRKERQAAREASTRERVEAVREANKVKAEAADMKAAAEAARREADEMHELVQKEAQLKEKSLAEMKAHVTAEVEAARKQTEEEKKFVQSTKQATLLEKRELARQREEEKQMLDQKEKQLQDNEREVLTMQKQNAARLGEALKGKQAAQEQKQVLEQKAEDMRIALVKKAIDLSEFEKRASDVRTCPPHPIPAPCHHLAFLNPLCAVISPAPDPLAGARRPRGQGGRVRAQGGRHGEAGSEPQGGLRQEGAGPRVRREGGAGNLVQGGQAEGGGREEGGRAQRRGARRQGGGPEGTRAAEGGAGKGPGGDGRR